MTSDRAATVRRVVAEQLGGGPPRAVRELGRGLDNSAYLAGDSLVVRFADGAGAAARVEREARLLELVGDLSPLPVPRPVFASPADGCLAYELLPGVPLLRLGGEERMRAAPAAGATLGALLRVLHAVEPARVASLVEVDDEPLEAWLREAAEHHAASAGAIPQRRRADVERFLAAPPPPRSGERVLSHNDLGCEHVLVDPATLRVTGVVDWSDAALCDPACDFGLILRDLGPAGLDAALAVYGARPAAVVERAGFYARCALLEDLAYGLAEGRDEYVVNALTALERL